MENAKTDKPNQSQNERNIFEIGLENDQIDYKAEYERFKAEKQQIEAEKKSLIEEVEKQKKIKDDYARENAEYKKQKQAQMTDDEKKAQELKDITESNEQLKSEIAQLKLERECLAHNFSTEETAILVKCKISFEAVKPIAELIQKRTDEAVKSAKVEFTKNSTPSSLVGNGSASGDSKSDFQKFQEGRKTDNNIVKL